LPFFPITRRKFVGLAATAGVAALGIDSVLLEPNRPRIVRQEIALRRWPPRLEGFTIALLSDFHYDPHWSVHPLRAAIPMVNGLRPDLIALTGDFVSVSLFSTTDKEGAVAAEPCAQLLSQLQAPHGLWAVMGNHDFFSDLDRVTSALQSHGIQVLANRSISVERDGSRFWLAGVGDVLGRDAHLDAALQPVPADEATILLAHEPDYADFVARRSVDLQLSGHSHGGQVRFPFLPPLYLPELARKYVSGFYRIGPLILYTNAGLGTIGVPVRLNCPPEITLLTLRRSVSQ
jgi:predicted MPP superfamily phosphohydrolase